MDITKRHINIATSVLFCIVVFLFWYVVYPHALSYQEQYQLFLWSGDPAVTLGYVWALMLVQGAFRLNKSVGKNGILADIASIDNNGNVTKPFLLPQRNPRVLIIEYEQ